MKWALIVILVVLNAWVSSQDAFFTCSSLKDWLQSYRNVDKTKCWLTSDCMEYQCTGSLGFKGQLRGKLQLQFQPCTTPVTYRFTMEATLLDMPVNVEYNGSAIEVPLLPEPQRLTLTVFLDQSDSMLVTQGAALSLPSDNTLLLPATILSQKIKCSFARELLYTGIAVFCLLMAGCMASCFVWIRVKSSSVGRRRAPERESNDTQSVPQQPLYGIPLELAGNVQQWSVADGIPQPPIGPVAGEVVDMAHHLDIDEESSTCSTSFENLVPPSVDATAPSSPSIPSVFKPDWHRSSFQLRDGGQGIGGTRDVAGPAVEGGTLPAADPKHDPWVNLQQACTEASSPQQASLGVLHDFECPTVTGPPSDAPPLPEDSAPYCTPLCMSPSSQRPGSGLHKASSWYRDQSLPEYVGEGNLQIPANADWPAAGSIIGSCQMTDEVSAPTNEVEDRLQPR